MTDELEARRFRLISGVFYPDEASQLLMTLIEDKISFHQRNNGSRRCTRYARFRLHLMPLRLHRGHGALRLIPNKKGAPTWPLHRPLPARRLRCLLRERAVMC
ncbi:MAG TPA: hypothetical protein DEG86_05405 [Halieaceae bacterium]|nr:hypothetical protein [Halieaceae bacterium]